MAWRWPFAVCIFRFFFTILLVIVSFSVFLCVCVCMCVCVCVYLEVEAMVYDGVMKHVTQSVMAPDEPGWSNAEIGSCAGLWPPVGLGYGMFRKLALDNKSRHKSTNPSIVIDQRTQPQYTRELFFHRVLPFLPPPHFICINNNDHGRGTRRRWHKTERIISSVRRIAPAAFGDPDVTQTGAFPRFMYLSEWSKHKSRKCERSCARSIGELNKFAQLRVSF